jgi:predicted MFS family arabinose efflux permease
MAARALQGVALASFVAPSIYAASMLAGVDPAKAIAVRSASIAAASSTAPYIAGLLVDYAGYTAGFAYATLSGLASAAASAALPMARRVRGRGGPPIREVLSSVRRLLPLFTASALDGVVFLGFQSLPQTHLKDLGYAASVFGLAMALNGAAGVPFRLYASRLAVRVGCLYSMALGYAAASAGMAALLHSVEPPYIYAAGVAYGAGLGLVVPSEQLLVVSNTPARVRNTVLSVYTLAFDIGGFAGSALLGALAEAHGYGAGYTAMLVAQLTSLAIVSTWAAAAKKSLKYG